MRRNWALIVPAAIVGLIVVTIVGGTVVQLLWNWLMPPLFGWHLITFWQALGLLLLSRILFGSWGSGGGNRGRRGRREKWDKMTPEEREKLRQNWGARCGGFPANPGESKEPA